MTGKRETFAEKIKLIILYYRRTTHVRNLSKKFENEYYPAIYLHYKVAPLTETIPNGTEEQLNGNGEMDKRTVLTLAICVCVVVICVVSAAVAFGCRRSRRKRHQHRVGYILHRCLSLSLKFILLPYICILIS